MTSNKWALADKVAVITGASKGIGLSCAMEFLDLGAEVVVVARGADVLEKAFAKRKGDRVHVVAADVSNAEGRAAVFKVIEKIGRLDVLLNNVGTNIRKQFVEFSAEELNFILNTNLVSALEMCREARPWLIKVVMQASFSSLR